MRSIARAGMCLVFFLVVGIAKADPSAAAPPSLTVTATFDKSSYVSGEEVSVKFSVHNSGTAPATGITARDDFSATELAFDKDGFGELGDGATIPAGGTVTVTVSGHLPSPAAPKVTLAGYLFDRRGNDVADFSFSAPVTVRAETVSGVVFGDVNSNGRADTGEGVSGVKVELSYLYGEKSYSVTSGGGGQFSVVVPRATYYLSGGGAGWHVVNEVVTVGAGGANLNLRAVRPLGDVLTAEMHFTKDTYAPGDTVHVVITLTNTGSSTLSGIGAECDHVGDPDELGNGGPGWGALTANGPGVTLLAHQTRTFDVTDKVPAAAQRAGQVVVACDFGYRGVDEGHRPTAGDTAKVPGLLGAIDGEVQYYPHGHGGTAVGLANVRLVLVDPTTCPVLTRKDTTDADGHFRIAHAPAGASYQLYIYPPTGWKVRLDNPTHVMVFGNDTSHFGFEVEHGSADVPSAPTTCASPPPSTPPTGPPLANTGTAPSGLAALGAAAILVGLILMLSTTRRRAH